MPDRGAGRGRAAHGADAVRDADVGGRRHAAPARAAAAGVVAAGAHPGGASRRSCITSAWSPSPGSVEARQTAEREAVANALHDHRASSSAPRSSRRSPTRCSVEDPSPSPGWTPRSATTCSATTCCGSSCGARRPDPLLRRAAPGRQRFDLDEDERGPCARAPAAGRVTDLDEPENDFERSPGKLLEVYHPVRTPGGELLLFEIYAPYDVVSTGPTTSCAGSPPSRWSACCSRSCCYASDRWAGCSPHPAKRDGGGTRLLQARPGRLGRRATPDRGRPARRGRAGAGGDVVRRRRRRRARPRLRGRRAQTTAPRRRGPVRGGIGGLRSLLVDIYPASLERPGSAALEDLATAARPRRHHVTSRRPPAPPAPSALVFQVARETLRNTARHARAGRVDVRLDRRPAPTSSSRWPTTGRVRRRGGARRPGPGHFGVRLHGGLPAGPGRRSRCAAAAPAPVAPGGATVSPAVTALIRVLLVDDHPLVRIGLAALLRRDPELECRRPGRGRSRGRRVGPRSRPNVVLMDLSMPRWTVSRRPATLATCPTPGSSCSPASSTPTGCGTRWTAGAIGYLLKDCEPTALLAAVRAAARGQVAPRPAGRRGAAADRPRT